jgi:hypothetical protein
MSACKGLLQKCHYHFMPCWNFTTCYITSVPLFTFHFYIVTYAWFRTCTHYYEIAISPFPFLFFLSFLSRYN